MLDRFKPRKQHGTVAIRTTRKVPTARGHRDLPSLAAVPTAHEDQSMVSEPSPPQASRVALLPAHTPAISIRTIRPRQPTKHAIVKETLLLSLEALSESADAFPPLKSAVCGLLFITRQVELISSNKSRIRELYIEIDAFASSLVHVISDVTALSLAHEAAINALERDLRVMCIDLETIVRQRPILCFLRARRHSNELQELMRRLSQAKTLFAHTMLVSMKADNSRILEDSSLILARIERIRNLVRSSRFLSFFLFFFLFFFFW